MSARAHHDIAELADPARWVDEHGDALLRFALQRVNCHELAEDLVQDAYLAAWHGCDSFDGRSEVRTWLMGILRHKISDYYRRCGRQPPVLPPGCDDLEDTLFDHAGKWVAAPRKWHEPPDRNLEDSEFRQVLASCVTQLPVHLAQAFEMRDLSLRPVSEICDLAGISAKNLSVRLHRARLLLRRCLEKHWFCPPDARR